MERTHTQPAILKIPLDIQRVLFAYCGGVARAASCSVSKLWYQQALSASQYLSASPNIYKYVQLGKSRITMTINKVLAVAVLSDYHLTVRINNHNLFTYQRELCLAGNQSVCELFLHYGHYPLPQEVILSPNRWFHENLPTDFSTTTSSRIHDSILYMLKHKHIEAILEYFSDTTATWLSDCNDYSSRMELAQAIVKTADMRLVQWILTYKNPRVLTSLCHAIVTSDAIDLLPAMRDAREIVWYICTWGSVAMYTRACELSIISTSKESLIYYAFENDNLILFEYFVSIGVSTSHLDYITGIANGALMCSLRILPQHINTRGIITVIADSGNVKLEEAMPHFQFTQDDFNHGLAVCIAAGNNTCEFVKYANNYNLDAYEQYGVVIIETQ